MVPAACHRLNVENVEILKMVPNKRKAVVSTCLRASQSHVQIRANLKIIIKKLM